MSEGSDHLATEPSKSEDVLSDTATGADSKSNDSSAQEPVVIYIGPTTKRRKGSSVSFQEKCEMFEVDLKGKPHRSEGPERPSSLRSVRYYIMVLALISPFVTTYSKTIINFAITDMIDTQWLEEQQIMNDGQTTTTVAPNNNNSVRVASFDEDNSCPVTSEEKRERLLMELDRDITRARRTEGEKFQWDTDKQGQLKAAYSIGHALLQVLGGRISEIYGSHYIMSISSLLIGFLCMAAPYLAALHFYLLFLDLMVLGILGSFMSPSLITLFSNWLTPSEKSLTLSFYLVSSRLGYALSSFLCGKLIGADMSWRYLFISAGWIGLAFSVSFFLSASSRPQDHVLMGQMELDYLASKNRLVRENLARAKNEKLHKAEVHKLEATSAGNENPTGDQKPINKLPGRNVSAPWIAILTNRAVWAFIVIKFCVKLAGDTVQIELPTYLKRVMHLSASANGNLNSLTYVIFCISCLAVGALAKWANKRRPFGLSKTVMRKTFQSVASFGVSISLLGSAYSVCDETATIIFLCLQFFVTTFSTGGEAQIPLDITERYSGTIHAIGSSIAVSGAIAPILIGYFLQGHASDRTRWAGVWYVASAISAFGGAFFLIFGDASRQPFDSIGIDQVNPVKKTSKEGKMTTKAGVDNQAFEPESKPSKIAIEDSHANEEPYRESRVI